MKKFLVSLLLLLSLCLSAYTVYSQKAGGQIPAGSLVYSLPQTVIEIKIEVIKETFTPGPYAGFADIYLSIDDAATAGGEKYYMHNIEVKPVIAADYESMFALPANIMKSGNLAFFEMLAEGPVFVGSKDDNASFAEIGSTLRNFQPFPDRLPSSPIEKKKISSYDKVKTDTGFIQVPYQQSIINEKDPERKAEEAAKFIFALRQRRFELITGDVDNAFGGSSLRDALDEINRLEREYLSLFLGRSTTASKEYTFKVVPEKSNSKTTYNVFRFSEVDGVLSPSVRNGRLITLDVTPSGKIKGTENINYEPGRFGTIYYRIPETAMIQLMTDNREICRGEMKIYQMGKDFGISADILIK